ncbi:NYN domain-containing protein [Pseudomonas oryzihabitans]|uniref:NYN domain-containing protein n=1 Tax=Pseudomonas oryzihabitans TaxID=47885 RepID=UPI00119EA93F|nr:NYN domain-containing protein [Pseudomonas oryzihabitans]
MATTTRTGVAWFVDGAYALSAWNGSVYGAKFDYLKLRLFIEQDAGEPIGDAYYFNCDSDPPTVAQINFNKFLSSAPPKGAGLRVKLYWLQSKAHEWPASAGGGPILHPVTGEQYTTKSQKGVDVGLAFNLMRSHAKRGWKKLYLVAGDGDFHEVVQYLVENEGVEVTVIGAHFSISGEIAPYVRVIEFKDIEAAIAR